MRSVLALPVSLGATILHLVQLTLRQSCFIDIQVLRHASAVLPSHHRLNLLEQSLFVVQTSSGLQLSLVNADLMLLPSLTFFYSEPTAGSTHTFLSSRLRTKHSSLIHVRPFAVALFTLGARSAKKAGNGWQIMWHAGVKWHRICFFTRVYGRGIN